ncbi:unnamed protein product [Vitrella brassicaformis CCMP3155]|uniref:Uncharacterized protein n=2 Tax=Vitrella brassicaformis TaxID=1169539 RepID=A0A0G4EQ64_VITBC|nr:unnamed protein product [Vitrella brassicaformis CCMP3155]|eukprot:CEL99547.1 unnamed protein product [Vitrella brassicaformis CCMP3155]
MVTCAPGQSFPYRVTLLSLAIDDALPEMPSVWNDRGVSEVMLPLWPSREAQAAILEALIADGRADPNRIDEAVPLTPIVQMGSTNGTTHRCPIVMALVSANLAAVDVLLQRRVGVRGLAIINLGLIELGKHRKGANTSEAKVQFLANLLEAFTRLLDYDPILATEAETTTAFLVDMLKFFGPRFVDGFLDQMVQHGCVLDVGFIQRAAMQACLNVLSYCCRKLPLSEIHNRAGTPIPVTPLEVAVQRIDMELTSGRFLPPFPCRADPRLMMTPPHGVHAYMHVARELLRAGAAIEELPTNSIGQWRQKALAKGQLMILLNSEIPKQTMDAVNAALRPHRELAALLTHLLPLAPHHDGGHPQASPSAISLGPQEAPAIAWKIAAFNNDTGSIQQALDGINLRADTTFGGRVHGAMAHFVKQATTVATSNREVVGGVRHDESGQAVRVPPLQCFAVGDGVGGSHRLIGLREVVHKARLDEAGQCGLGGQVVKGFKEQLGNGDCEFEWSQLGYFDKKGRFVLGIN